MWKVKVYMLVEPEDEELYATKKEAESVEEQELFLHPTEVLTTIVECDENGEEK